MKTYSNFAKVALTTSTCMHITMHEIETAKRNIVPGSSSEAASYLPWPAGEEASGCYSKMQVISCSSLGSHPDKEREDVS